MYQGSLYPNFMVADALPSQSGRFFLAYGIFLAQIALFRG